MKLCKECGSDGPFAWRRGICNPCYHKKQTTRRNTPGPARDRALAKQAAAAAVKRAARKVEGLCMDCGVPVEGSRCIDCLAARNALTTALVAGRKRTCVALLGGACKDCGLVSEYPAVYDFHHPDPEQKDFNIAKIFTYKWATVLAELGKCILLCANCHRLRHAMEP